MLEIPIVTVIVVIGINPVVTVHGETATIAARTVKMVDAADHAGMSAGAYMLTSPDASNVSAAKPADRTNPANVDTAAKSTDVAAAEAAAHAAWVSAATEATAHTASVPAATAAAARLGLHCHQARSQQGCR